MATSKHLFLGYEEIKKQQDKAKKQENVTTFNNEQNRELTSKEKDEMLTMQADAIMKLTERLNKLDGGAGNE
ncbi:hypothetical protein [Oceanobacillus picturae]|uniref:hypothetical protein n=1 Tax=Oceanobacillus picturae TaxID=171693 RepID=UPI000E6833FC|nr:hypothetical protein [Oceanobacillus picturae]RIU93304.1 hypothetical protein D1864_07475 [Oceanobacillus picturae]